MTRLSSGVRLVAWVMFLLMGRASLAVAVDCQDDAPRTSAQSVASAKRVPPPDLLPASDHAPQEREAGICLCACGCARSQVATADVAEMRIAPAPSDTEPAPALALPAPPSFSSPPRLRPPLA